MSIRAVVVIAAVSSIFGISSSPSRAAAAAATTDLTGYWRFDPAHSDVPRAPEGGAARTGMRGGGGWGGRGGQGGRTGGDRWRGGARSGGGRGDRASGSGDRADARPLMLPDLIHVTQTSTVVSLEDSAGVVLEEITTIGSATDTLAHAPGARVSRGAWQDTALVVDRGGSNGFKLVRTITLEQQGQVLVMLTHFEAPGGEPPRDFRRVYRRVTEG